MEQFVVLKVPETNIWKQQCLCPVIMIHLLRIIRRACCEKFHTGTVFFLPNAVSQCTKKHASTYEQEAHTCPPQSHQWVNVVITFV